MRKKSSRTGSRCNQTGNGNEAKRKKVVVVIVVTIARQKRYARGGSSPDSMISTNA